MDENDALNNDDTNPYDALSELRDYLEDIIHPDMDNDTSVDVELSVEEIEWILDRIYEAKSGPSVGTDIDNYSDEDD